jgi:glycolate oxidase FAD binding subunit
MVPGYVVYPASGEQVAAVLRCASEHNLAVIACRNATKLATGNLPRRYDLALSLKELNRIWHYEPADLTVSVEPGMKFGDFQHFVGHDGLWLPLDPRGGARASLGGILATNSAGALRLRYGAPRDMVLGMKVATTEGKLIKTGGRVVKNVAGYDLAKLLIGSYGTLGVIVEASLKLCPVPVGRATFVLQAETLGLARELRRAILLSPIAPLRVLLLDGRAATLARARSQAAPELGTPEMWVEVGGSERVIERCAGELERMSRGASVPLIRLQAAEAGSLWARISDFDRWLVEAYPRLAALKVGLPIASGEEFLTRARQEAEGESAELAGFAQVGVGAVHLSILEPKSAVGFVRLIAQLRKAAEDLDGSLGIERCPFDLKASVDAWGSPGDDFEAMRELKAVWDAKGVLAPGRYVGGL